MASGQKRPGPSREPQTTGWRCAQVAAVSGLAAHGAERYGAAVRAPACWPSLCGRPGRPHHGHRRPQTTLISRDLRLHRRRQGRALCKAATRALGPLPPATGGGAGLQPPSGNWVGEAGAVHHLGGAEKLGEAFS